MEQELQKESACAQCWCFLASKNFASIARINKKKNSYL